MAGVGSGLRGVWGSRRPDLMGWIYNGSEFIKANKSQRDAYNKYNQQQLIKQGLAEPFTVPALALVGASLVGVVSIGSLAALFWGPFKDAVDEGIATVGDIPGEIKAVVVQTLDDAGVSGAEQSKYETDLLACVRAHPARIDVPWARNVKDPFRGAKVLTCMTRKGWGSDMVIETLAHLLI